MKAVRRRVVVSGIGVLSAVGIGRDAFWSGVHSARSPVRRIDRFDPASFRSQVAAQIDDFEPLDHMDGRAARTLDRFSQFGVAAGRMAVADAALEPGTRGAPAAERIGVYIGSALGGIAFAESQHERYLAKGIRSVSPMLALAVFGGAAPANLGIALNLRGPILSTANSCAAGAVAIGEAVAAIRQGTIDAAVAGGIDCPLSPLAFGAFDVIRALSNGHNDAPERAARPFDRQRDGFVMGEGAGLLVLEAWDVAVRRGSEPYAEVLGYAATSDAHHMVQPRPDGREAARAVTLALVDARVDASEIDYVSAHASSTPIGDVAEARALVRALGPHASVVSVSGTKALTGHPLGATGAIEAAMCGLVIRDRWAPGTANLETPDEETASLLPRLLRDGAAGDFRRLLSTSFGFGGLNAALVFGRPDG